jgi:hypothetical protein
MQCAQGLRALGERVADSKPNSLRAEVKREHTGRTHARPPTELSAHSSTPSSFKALA